MKVELGIDMTAKPGDVIVVEERHVGERGRMGEIVEVLGEPGHEHYRVRWEDGPETIFYPTAGTATIKRTAPIRT